MRISKRSRKATTFPPYATLSHLIIGGKLNH